MRSSPRCSPPILRNGAALHRPRSRYDRAMTAHSFRTPAGERVGFDTSVSFGPDGIGLTDSIVHDETGPFGTVSQSLTVRRR